MLIASRARCGALLPLLVAAAYWPALNNGFVWLDDAQILRRARIATSWSQVVNSFEPGAAADSYYRPLFSALHSLNFAMAGADALVFQLTDVLVHCATAVMVFATMQRFGLGASEAYWTAAVWGIHPVNTATVGIISSRPDLLAAFFMCATILVLGRAPKSGGSAVRIAAGAFLFLGALLSKELAFALPVGVLAGLLSCASRPAVARQLVAWSVVACGATSVFLFPLETSVGNAALVSWSERLLTFIPVYNGYLLAVVFPDRLFLGDSARLFASLTTPTQIAELAAFALAVATQVALWRKFLWARPWILVWNVGLAPVSQVVPTLHFRADRFLYVPSLGLIGVMVRLSTEWIRAVYGSPHSQLVVVRLAQVLGGLTMLLYCSLTWERLLSFGSDVDLFSRELVTEPEYREGLTFLAQALDKRGAHEVAAGLWRRSLETREDLLSYVDREAVVVNLSANLLARAKFEEAENLLRQSLPLIGDGVVRQQAIHNYEVARRNRR